jgi:hypothetical protein
VTSCARSRPRSRSVLDGADRARALAHVASCAACRRYLDELSRTADALLLEGPEAEPPVGFEQATAALLRPTVSRVARWRVLAAAAALAALAGTVGVVVGRRTVDGRGDLRTASILARDGRQVGEVSVHDGTSSWCLVSVSSPGVTNTVHARLRDGRTVPIQTFSVRDGVGSYGVMLVRGRDIVQVRLVAPSGGLWATADLSTT